jgi:hypothetical protein
MLMKMADSNIQLERKKTKKGIAACKIVLDWIICGIPNKQMRLCCCW